MGPATLTDTNTTLSAAPILAENKTEKIKEKKMAPENKLTYKSEDAKTTEELEIIIPTTSANPNTTLSAAPVVPVTPPKETAIVTLSSAQQDTKPENSPPTKSDTTTKPKSKNDDDNNDDKPSSVPAPPEKLDRTKELANVKIHPPPENSPPTELDLRDQLQDHDMETGLPMSMTEGVLCGVITQKTAKKTFPSSSIKLLCFNFTNNNLPDDLDEFLTCRDNKIENGKKNVDGEKCYWKSTNECDDHMKTTKCRYEPCTRYMHAECSI